MGNPATNLTEGSSSPLGLQGTGRGRVKFLLGFAGELLPATLAIIAILIVWEVLARLTRVPVYIVPAPSIVLSRLLGNLSFFFVEGAITLGGALAGFVIGSVVALVVAIFMSHSRLLEKTLLPLAILVKVTPIVAVAPLFIIWFGFNMLPKVLITALMTFFPVLINAITGFRSVNPTSVEFLRSLNASPREIFLKLRFPSSLPYLFAAFRVSLALCLIGAVVAEWFGASRGLGMVIILANSNMDMPTLFASIIVLGIIGVALTVITSFIEKRTVFWHESVLSN